MARYRLTRAADRDLERLFDFGIDRFGPDRALDYVEGLKAQFQAVADNPALYQSVDHIRPGYRRCVYRAHSLYYKAGQDGIIIIRILGREHAQAVLPEGSE